MALNENVSGALERHMRTVTVRKYIGESLSINGEATDTAPESFDGMFAVLPMSQKELQVLPEGVYDKFDRKFYSADSYDIPNESVFEVGSEKFKILSRDDRSFEGGFCVYYGKRIRQGEI